MKKYRNIIFDFDGTLVDTAPLIITTMRAAANKLNLAQRSDAALRSTIGLRLEETPAKLWPEDDISGDLFASTYRRIFDELKRPLKVNCYPGVIETLKFLRNNGFQMVIASSRSHKSLAEYVESFDIADCFSAIIGGNDVEHGKPSPMPVLTIFKNYGWNAEQSLVVGDAAVDIKMGSATQTDTCAVTYGNGTVEQLSAVNPTYTISSFESLTPILFGVDNTIVEYVVSKIIPQYDSFDKAHRRDHVRMVIDQSLKLADKMPGIDVNMAYCIAAYHDLGLINGRENHHIDSGHILRSDKFIARYFTPEQISIMSDAVEDHRASGKTAPRSDYGKIVADADRFIDAETIIRRTVQYGIANYPHLDRDGHYKRTIGHLKEKYGPQGYLRIWLPWSDNISRLKHLHAIIADPVKLHDIFDRIYDEETNAVF